MYGIHKITKAELERLLDEGYQIDEMAITDSSPERIEELRRHTRTIRRVGGRAKAVQVGKKIYSIFK